MEKICIVKRRKTTASVSQDPVVEIHAVPPVTSPVNDQEVAQIEQIPEVSSPSPMIASPESFNIQDGDHLIFKEVAGEEEQIFSIQLSPEQSQVVQSMNCIKDLLSGKHHGVKMSMEETADGSTAFNFHFKPVYTTRMLNPNDVAVMLQISKSMLYRLVKRREIKSYKIGKLRRFLLEDVVDYLSNSLQM
ncbi:MAG: Helix-turn-helix domain [Deltaproteobacteria bacterium]|nr:Helix-turn-helix domain [Deltaproteobacteria bacterium]